MIGAKSAPYLLVDLLPLNPYCRSSKSTLQACSPFVVMLESTCLSRQTPDRSGRRGSNINVASLLSFQGRVTVPAYAVSKGGVAQLTKALSNERASKGVAVNAIAPGYVNTDMNKALTGDNGRANSILSRIPAGRWGQADDFKGPVLFLASGASSYVSGEMLVVDRGWMGR